MYWVDNAIFSKNGYFRASVIYHLIQLSQNNISAGHTNIVAVKKSYLIYLDYKQ